MTRDDAQCVHRCIQGDADAFAELVRRYQHAVYGLALSYVHSFADAEDLAQEAFIAAYQNLHRLREPARFAPWLKTIAVNLCRNWQRNRKAETNSIEKMEREIGGDGPEKALEGRHDERA